MDCLWFGLVDEDKAPLAAEKLMSAQMFSGCGVRTLATDMGAYNPASYQLGLAARQRHYCGRPGAVRFRVRSAADRHGPAGCRPVLGRPAA